MKYFVLITLFLSQLALAGPNQSRLGGGPGGGMMPMPRPLPLPPQQERPIVTVNLTRPSLPQICHIDQALAPVPPPKPPTPPAPKGPSQSEIKATELRSYYDAFSVKDRPTRDDAKQFTKNVVGILLRYKEHIPIAKGYFTSETRPTYKALYASIVYFADPTDPEIVNFLRNEGRCTQREFDEMDRARADMAAGAFECVGYDPFESITRRFINGL
jgi:hypothetical protein